jgi:hypothetical protein
MINSMQPSQLSSMLTILCTVSQLIKWLLVKVVKVVSERVWAH